MRKFKTTPQKKFVGMIILFVLIPLFLLAYIFLVIDWRPGLDTVVIVAAIAILAFYFYLQYKKQLTLQGKAQVPLTEESLDDKPMDEEDALPEDGEFSKEELIEDDEALDETFPEKTPKK